LEIGEDLKSGMSVEEVQKKPYKYKMEMYYYTMPEYVPKGDLHWSACTVLNLDEFLDRMNGVTMTTKILESDEPSLLRKQSPHRPLRDGTTFRSPSAVPS
jgi:hypothetical protein